MSIVHGGTQLNLIRPDLSCLKEHKLIEQILN